jgi:glycosyltransferase involved in cell wall biosynthesis
MFDVFCLPSTWEGLGLVLLEAMFRGVPIIGSRAGAIPEILDNGNYGLLFQSGDAEGLRRAIIKAHEDPEALARLALSARLYAEKNFRVETMIKKTIEVYKAVLAEGGMTTDTTSLHGESTCRPG